MDGNCNPTRKDGGSSDGEAIVDTLILKYDRLRDHLEIGGNVSSTDLALDILGRATRYTEAQWRQQRMLEAANALAQAQHDRAIVESLRKGN
jgi:hypothetical protein